MSSLAALSSAAGESPASSSRAIRMRPTFARRVSQADGGGPAVGVPEVGVVVGTAASRMPQPGPGALVGTAGKRWQGFFGGGNSGGGSGAARLAKHSSQVLLGECGWGGKRAGALESRVNLGGGGGGGAPTWTLSAKSSCVSKSTSESARALAIWSAWRGR